MQRTNTYKINSYLIPNFFATYDVWGKQTITKNTIGITRGYTGHEHWNQFGLIDMNGRFYDPQIARFLSPDPYVQDPSVVQNYNRYSYCMNNPLKYTDPSGMQTEMIPRHRYQYKIHINECGGEGLDHRMGYYDGPSLWNVPTHRSDGIPVGIINDRPNPWYKYETGPRPCGPSYYDRQPLPKPNNNDYTKEYIELWKIKPYECIVLNK